MICKGCGNEYEPRHARDHRCESCYAKAGRRSKRKGSNNELRFSKMVQSFFDDYGFPYKARRTPRSGAIHDFEAADLLISAPHDSVFSKVHFENKNAETWSIPEWYDKATKSEEESGKNRNVALIIRKPNISQEFAVIDSKWFLELLCNNEVLRKDG